MATTTAYARAFLRSLYAKACKSRLTLYDSLMTTLTGQVEKTETGLVIKGTTGNGESVTFGVPGGSGAPWYNATTITELCGEFVDRYETSQAWLGEDLPEGESPSDCAIFEHMLSRMSPVTSFITHHAMDRQT